MGSNVRVSENIDLLLDAYDYELPLERIAQNPVEPRDSARLLVADFQCDRSHRIFRQLPDLLAPGDLLVLNDTRVIRARLYGRKPSGAQVEVLLLEERSLDTWLALVKPGKRLKPGAKIEFSPRADSSSANSAVISTLTATVLARDEATGGRIVKFDLPPDTSLVQQLDRFGQVPLPPYITDSEAPPDRYQTVYAQHPGSAAAPTAGLHFTDELLGRLDDRGIDRTFVTLHVGVGTFRPVETAEITQHKMHGEWVDVSADTVDKIRQTQARGGRVIAVGTTVVRSLESAARGGTLAPFCSQTDLFIYPGYRWQVVDGLITNFHLPRSSLLMLVSAMVGRERLLELYREALDLEYRFFSFGDAMLLGNSSRGALV